MKVKDLKQLLKGLEDNEEIVLSTDAEGETFHQIAGLFTTAIHIDSVSNYAVIGEQAIDLGGTKGHVLYPTG